MPGPHKGEAFAKVFKLGTQEVVDIKLLEFQEGFFDVVWTVISFQGFRTLIWCSAFGGSGLGRKIKILPEFMAENLSGGCQVVKGIGG